MMSWSKILKITTVFIFLRLITSCGDATSIGNNGLKSGVVLTFDDYAVEDWVFADSIFKSENWKATFCVTKFPELSEKRKKGILFLQTRGNEIAFHGTHHVKAIEYILTHTVSEYLDYEILPGLKAMQDYGLDITSFAYPYGNRSSLTDSFLANYFSVLRGTTYEGENCFVTNNNFVEAIGIDSHYEHMSLSFLELVLSFAKDNNQIVVFYGHKIRENDTNPLVTKISTIRYICEFVNKNGMEFYTLKDIVDLGR